MTILSWVLGALFVGMGVSHFIPRIASNMAAMIPPALRGTGVLSPANLVIFTGVCEIAGGIGLAVPTTRGAAAIALAVFLAAVFPANAYAAQHPERFGRAAIPFWPRLIAQFVLIALLIVLLIF